MFKPNEHNNKEHLAHLFALGETKVVQITMLDCVYLHRHLERKEITHVSVD